LLSGLSIILGTNHVMLTESSSTISGVDEEPARFVQPVEESQRRLFTIVRVEFCQAQAARISPLWRRTAAGYLPRPEESRILGVPIVNPVILFWESLCIATGMSLIIPVPDPPSTIIRSEFKDTRTAAGHS
jgi:hypothetical protein